MKITISVSFLKGMGEQYNTYALCLDEPKYFLIKTIQKIDVFPLPKREEKSCPISTMLYYYHEN